MHSARECQYGRHCASVGYEYSKFFGRSVYVRNEFSGNDGCRGMSGVGEGGDGVRHVLRSFLFLFSFSENSTVSMYCAHSVNRLRVFTCTKAGHQYKVISGWNSSRSESSK